MFVERIYGSLLLCYVHSIDDFFYLWLGQLSIVEAGAIASILFSSWAGADHSALVESPPPSHVCWAQSQMDSAAELHLAVIIIMIEREGGPRYCFD
jgi:hypothetical protein